MVLVYDDGDDDDCSIVKWCENSQLGVIFV